MRTFIIKMHHELTPFSLNNLPENRMDLVARCVNSALWLDHNIRRDVVIYFSFSNNKVVRIDGKVKTMNPDERNIASFFSHMQEGKTYPGIELTEKTFDQLISEFENIYYLDMEGKQLSEQQFTENAVFVLGDDIGVEAPADSNKISVGPRSYLTSHCITVLNNHLDRSGL